MTMCERKTKKARMIGMKIKKEGECESVFERGKGREGETMR